MTGTLDIALIVLVYAAGLPMAVALGVAVTRFLDRVCPMPEGLD